MTENKVKNEVKNQSEPNKEVKTGKKKAVIAGSVAAGITAVVAAITIVSLTRPDLSNQNQSYSIKISSEFEGFKNSNLTINKGTKIEDLIEVIKVPVEGYKVEGLYQDFACTKPYSPETVITEDMQIFVKFELEKYTVTAYADTSKTQVLETVKVNYGNDAVLQTPTKAADKVGKYRFAGWTDAMGNPVSLTNIKTDTEVFASFEVSEYVNYVVSELPSQVKVNKGSGENETAVATGDNLHYGDRVKIVYTPSTGHQMKTFTVDGAELVDGAENWYEITGELVVTYTEEKIAYVVGDLPKQVTILDSENNKVESGATLLYDDIITITYTPTAGFIMSEFEVSGAYPVEGLGAGENKYIVRGNISVVYSEIENPDIEYLNYENYKDGYIITGLNDDTIEDIVIPAQYRGKKVYGIKDAIYNSTGYAGAFRGKTNIKTVTVKEGVENIGKYSFYECPNLTTVTILNGVTSISESTFRECTGLISITLPNSITSIDKYAFYKCEKLASINIPDSVNGIGEHAFSDCKSLSTISIPSSTIVGNQVFTSCTGLKTVYLEEGITTLGSWVFYNCTGLTSVNIPKSLTNMGENIFRDCTGLRTVNFEEGLTTIGVSMFAGCSALTTVKIPNSVTNMGSSAFDVCNNLIFNEFDNALYLGNDENPYIALIKSKDIHVSEIKINERTKLIHSSAFNYNKFISIIIPKSVTSIGESVFASCNELMDIKVEEGNTKYTSRDNSGNEINGIIDIEMKKLISGCKVTKIPNDESVNTIAKNSYTINSNLTSIIIPENITFIETMAFNNCNKLTTVIIESSAIYKIATSTSSAGSLLRYATTVKVLAIADDGSNSYLNENYTQTTETIDGKTYNIYTKK